MADKATIYAYTAYIEEIQDDIETDDEGNIPQEMCSYYERLIDNAVAVAMQGEISDFKSYVDPAAECPLDPGAWRFRAGSDRGARCGTSS